MVTSDKCYRNDGGGRAFREDDPLGGDDPYSASKAAQEHTAAAFRALGLPLATVRAGNAIGGGDWAADRLVADCMRAALAGEPVTLRAPDAVRPWQHVLNPLEGYLTVAERLLAGDAGRGGSVELRSATRRTRGRWGGSSSASRTAGPARSRCGSARRRGGRGADAAARRDPCPRAARLDVPAGTLTRASTLRCPGTQRTATVPTCAPRRSARSRHSERGGS